MHTTAIICEFDPLHRGHEYLISEARRAGADSILCVMSGAFCQRGEPSSFEKHTRARAAIAAGADVVLELPFPYSCASAEFFASGAVGVIAAVGGVDTLAFGCECGDAQTLLLAAERTATQEFTDKYNELSTARPELGAAALFELCYSELYGEGSIFSGANNVLAIEYIRAARRLGLDIEFQAVKRVGAGHGEMTDPSCEPIHPVGEGLAPYRALSNNRTVILERSEGSECDRNIAHSRPSDSHLFASASLIREKLRAGEPVDDLLPDSTRDIILGVDHSNAAKRSVAFPKEGARRVCLVLKGDRVAVDEDAPLGFRISSNRTVILEGGHSPTEGSECECNIPLPTLARAERAILSHFRLNPAAAQTAELAGGLGNRMADAASRARSYEEFFSLSRTKKYTDARIRRAVVLSMCGVEDADLHSPPAYTTLLALSERGAAFLSERKKQLAIPLVSNPAMLGTLPAEAQRAYTLARRAEALRALCTEDIRDAEEALRTPPAIVK